MHETIEFVQRLQKIKYIPYRDNIAIITIYPGTQLCEIAVDKHFITDDYWLTDGMAPIYQAELSLSELEDFRERIIDAVAFERIFSWRGFKAQYHMVPSIIKYFVGNTYYARRFIFGGVAQGISPKLRSVLRAVYYSNRSRRSRPVGRVLGSELNN